MQAGTFTDRSSHQMFPAVRVATEPSYEAVISNVVPGDGLSKHLLSDIGCSHPGVLGAPSPCPLLLIVWHFSSCVAFIVRSQS